MAKPARVSTPKQLEGFIANKLANGLFFQSELQDKIAEAMQDKIISNVYDAYEPYTYERRGNDTSNTEAFSHMDNMEFTSVDVSNGVVRFIFENTAEGNDSMSGKELTAMFEKGIRENWNNPDATDKYGRIVSTPRPFIEDTIKNLNGNKGRLTEALRRDLRRMGFETN